MPEAGDAERLVVLLEARIRDFEKNMQKASGTAGREYGKMRKDSRSATRDMEQDMQRSTARINQMLAGFTTKIGGMGKAFAGGLVGGLVAGGVAGIASQIADVAKSIAQVGDEAKRAGIGVEQFQQWRFVAEQNRIGVDQLVDGFKELNLRADELIQTGAGPAAEAFARLGYSAEDLKRKLQDPSALMLEIIGRLKDLDRAAQIRIADEIFGGSAGERFVELIDQGKDGIRATMEEAQNLGLVMDKDVIDRAAELDRKFNAVTATVSTGLKTAIVEAAGALSEFINTFRGWWDDYEKRRASFEQARELGALVGSMAGGKPMPMAPGPPETRTTPKTDRLPEAEWKPIVLPKSSLRGGGARAVRGGGSRDRAAEEAKHEAEAVRDLIAEMEHELSLIGMTDEQRRAAEISRRAGAAATDEERAKIVMLNEELHRQAEAYRVAKETGEFLKDTLGTAIADLIPVIETGNDALDRMLNTLIEAVAQAALLGQGPLAGLFGGGGGLLAGLFSLFGFAKGGVFQSGNVIPFAHGGVVNRPTLFPMARGAGLMGEAGPEAILPLRRDAQGRLGVGGGASSQRPIQIEVVSRFDADGGFESAVARTSEPIAIRAANASTAKLAGNIPAMVDNRNDQRQYRKLRPAMGGM
jgi:hypothetical protein